MPKSVETSQTPAFGCGGVLALGALAIAAWALFTIGTLIAPAISGRAPQEIADQVSPAPASAPPEGRPWGQCPQAMTLKRCLHWEAWLDAPVASDWLALTPAEKGELAALWGLRFDARDVAQQAATGLAIAACVNKAALQAQPSEPLRPIVAACLP